MRGAGASLFLALALAMPVASAQASWPTVALPSGVQRYDMGEQMNVNGVPLRMRGFLSQSPPARLAEWFRNHFGKHYVENNIGGKLVFGRAEGEFYVTVQLEAVGSGTRGLVAVSHLKQGAERFAQVQDEVARLLMRMPAGSRMVTQMASSEGGKLSRYLVITNALGVELNRDRLVDMMREDGMGLQREARPGAGIGRVMPSDTLDGRTMFFQGPGRDAMAVVSRGPDGVTTLVLHTLTTMERIQ